MDKDAKNQFLHRAGALNSKARQVSDSQFTQEEFFDPLDLVQVKYEMLRRVRTEGRSVTDAARAFGMSRFSFYQAQFAFQQEGLPGLLSKKPGPRSRHKITPEVLEFVRKELLKDPSPAMGDLLSLLKERFGLSVHRRTIERALSGRKKKRH
jgi:transposase